MATTFLRLPSVKQRTGLSRSAIYQRVSEGSFPPPVSLGARRRVDRNRGGGLARAAHRCQPQGAVGHGPRQKHSAVTAGKGGRRTCNPRLVKIHRNYSVEDAARLLDVHKNTIREWISRGLPTVDRQRPTLILGRDLADYIARRRSSGKQPCGPGHIYCVRCRRPQSPAGGMADYAPVNASSGNLIGICPVCDALMYRRVSTGKLEAVRGNLDVRLPVGLQHIVESRHPSVNRDFWQE